MATERDAIESMRNRLLAKIREKEAEIAEIKATYDALGVAPKLLEGKFKSVLEDRVSPAAQQPRTLANRNVTELVRQYVADRRAFNRPTLEEFKREALINIPDVVDWLKRQGVKGKDRSLYSAIHVILKKETDRNAELHYKKGVGFFKGNEPADNVVG